MAQVTIYGLPLSTYVRTACMACQEKGVSYALEPVEFGGEALRKLHPFGKMPAFRHGELTLYETSAICRYVDAAFAGPSLEPEGLAGRALCEQWVSAIKDYLYPDLIVRYVLEYVFAKGPGGQPDRAAIDAALPAVRRDFGVLERALAGGPYLAGDRPTLADLFLAPILFYVDKMPEGAELLGSHPNVRRALATMSERPSFKATLPQLPG